MVSITINVFDQPWELLIPYWAKCIAAEIIDYGKIKIYFASEDHLKRARNSAYAYRRLLSC